MFKDKLNIGFDMDGVIACFTGGFLQAAKKMGYAEHFPASTQEWNTWHPPGGADHFNEVWKTIEHDPEFWENLPVTDYSVPHIRWISENVDFFVTARPIPSEVSERWLRKHGFITRDDQQVITVDPASEKDDVMVSLEIDYFLEDKVANFFAINEKSAAFCYLLTVPSNADTDLKNDCGTMEPCDWNSLRVDSIAEFIDAITISDDEPLPDDHWKTHDEVGFGDSNYDVKPTDLELL